VIEGIALITNTIPGMVLGLAFLFCFSGTSLQSTFLILVLCNMIHYFDTVSDDEGITGEVKWFLGNDSDADGR